ncbi:MAG: hypothetical protein LBR94_01255 [Desulfovibrio sp.]|jgi:hypothetical protein|nr:hypothetical protein [Desulfovibrio sp.]
MSRQMKTDIEAECPCIKADCARHGDCVACSDHHVGMENPSFCKRPGVAASAEFLQRVSARLKAVGG